MPENCCGCLPRKRKKKSANELYEPLLLESERDAINDLLRFLQTDDGGSVLSDERVRALRTLACSDNVDLKRSAALCYSEISEKMTSTVTNDMLEPLIALVQYPDPEVQTASSLALSNFALFGPVENKNAIVRAGALQALTACLSSDNVDVQCNACGCMTTLATSEHNKYEIVNQGAVPSLLKLACSRDSRVQRNATGALLNLTHLESNRFELARCGAIPIFVSLIQSRDPDIQFYCAAALSNMAVQEQHRSLMSQISGGEVLRHLIALLSSPVEKVKCQACLALRNLASDANNQVKIVDFGGLRSLYPLLGTSDVECCTAAIAALRNLSICKGNEIAIIREKFLPVINKLLVSGSHPDIQCHAAGTLRNLSTEDHKDEILKAGSVTALVDVLLDSHTSVGVCAEASAALAVLAANERCQEHMAELRDGQFVQAVLEMCVSAEGNEVRYNCVGIVGHLALNAELHPLLLNSKASILEVIRTCVQTGDASSIHIGVWALSHLSEGGDETRRIIGESRLMDLLERMGGDDMATELKQLIDTTLKNLQPKVDNT